LNDKLAYDEMMTRDTRLNDILEKVLNFNVTEEATVMMSSAKQSKQTLLAKDQQQLRCFTV